FPLLAFLEPATAAPGTLFMVLFALLAVIGAVAVARADGALYLLGALLAVTTEAVWSVEYLTPERLHAALGLYLSFALLYVATPAAARRRQRALASGTAGGLVLLASLGLLFFLAAGPVAHLALWAIGLLLAIVNVGLTVTAGASRWPLVRLAGIVVSWVI